MTLNKPVLAASLLALLAACASPRIPVVEPASGIARPPDYVSGGRPEPGLDDVWWRGFGDPALGGLVERALVPKQLLEAARQRLATARAITVVEGSNFLPTNNAEASGDIFRHDAGHSTDRRASLSDPGGRGERPSAKL